MANNELCCRGLLGFRDPLTASPKNHEDISYNALDPNLSFRRHINCANKTNTGRTASDSHTNSGDNEMHVNGSSSTQRPDKHRYDNCFQELILFLCYKLLTRHEYARNDATSKIRHLQDQHLMLTTAAHNVSCL